jgi:hypothetical protein
MINDRFILQIMDHWNIGPDSTGNVMVMGDVLLVTGDGSIDCQESIVIISNWFFMTPSIATKFQYVHWLLFSFLLTTCFGPYGPSSSEIYN